MQRDRIAGRDQVLDALAGCPHASRRERARLPRASSGAVDSSPVSWSSARVTRPRRPANRRRPRPVNPPAAGQEPALGQTTPPRPAEPRGRCPRRCGVWPAAPGSRPAWHRAAPALRAPPEPGRKALVLLRLRRVSSHPLPAMTTRPAPWAPARRALRRRRPRSPPGSRTRSGARTGWATPTPSPLGDVDGLDDSLVERDGDLLGERVGLGSDAEIDPLGEGRSTDPSSPHEVRSMTSSSPARVSLPHGSALFGW